MTKLYGAAALLAAICVLVVGAYLISIYGRPPMPVPLGTVLWDYETGFTVANVTRHPLRPGVTAYDVTVRVFCPFGERYVWTPRSAHAIDNSGRAYYATAATPAHRVLGASETERMSFELPEGVEQPALVFDETLGSGAILDELRVGRLYEPHRFNLRYD